MTKISVLFVCLGNICRSPLAEGIFRDKVEQAGLGNDFHIDSCGTAAYHVGEQPDSRSVANAVENGLHYSHEARQFIASDFQEFDYILPMDTSNYHNVMKLEPTDHSAIVSLMRKYDVEGKGMDVPDPYYGGERGFQDVFDILNRSAESLLAEIKESRLG